MRLSIILSQKPDLLSMKPPLRTLVHHAMGINMYAHVDMAEIPTDQNTSDASSNIDVLHEPHCRSQDQPNLLIRSSDVVSLLKTDLQAQGSDGKSQQGEERDIARAGSTSKCLDRAGTVAAVAACTGVRGVVGATLPVRRREVASARVVAVTNPDTVLPATSARAVPGTSARRARARARAVSFAAALSTV